MSRFIHPRMALSPRFTLADLCASQTADKLGLYNLPRDVAEVENLKALCMRVLEPVADRLRGDVRILSGFRTQTLNRLMGDARDSAYVFGQGADVMVAGIPAHDVALSVSAMDDLPFHQLVLVHRTLRDGKTCSYVHLSHRRLGGNDRRVRTCEIKPETRHHVDGIFAAADCIFETAA